MKHFKLTFLLIALLLCQIVYSQSGWVIKNPFPNTRDDIGDIYFINDLTGFLATSEYRAPEPYYGRIYVTNDGGLSWRILILDTSAYISKFYFMNNITGFAFGSKMYKTTNSGTTWFIPTTTSFRSITFVDSINGYGCGNADEYRPYIHKTTNGGNYWYTIPHNLTGYYLTMWDIYFTNILTGFITGESLVLAKTTNGGNNWELKVGQYWGIYTDIEFVNDSVGYVTGNNQDSLILKTTNYGENWYPANVQFNNFAFMESIKFMNNSTGFCVGSEKIIKSTDSGNNWNEIINPLQGLGYNHFNKVYFKNSTTGQIVGDYCGFLKTTNGGINWNFLIRGDTLNAIYFINHETGYSVGYNGLMFKTTNNGNNWFITNSGTGYTIKDLVFKDSLNGIYVGRNGIVGKTANSGNNWTVNVINNQVNLKDVSFLDNSIGLIAGTEGKIYKTTNFGQTWLEKSTGTSLNINSVYCNSGVTVSVGDSGIVLRSTTQGENWLFQFVTPRIRLNSVAFLNGNTGFIVGDSGKVFKTTNAGINWTIKLPYTNYNLNNINFVNSYVGYIVGNWATCLKTTDGGITWGFQNIGLHQICNLYKICALDTMNLFLTGADQYIFKTTDGGGNIILSIPVTNNIPIYFILHQNYPNPFNPSTTIKFSIPSPKGVTKLTIYDILGREVAVLVNERLSPGTYEVEWNANNYASGIYFYRLETEKFIQTKKMVLLK